MNKRKSLPSFPGTDPCGRNRRTRRRLIPASILLIGLALVVCRNDPPGGEEGRISSASGPPVIEVWYGADQSFGHLGRPQRWANILGRVHPAPDGTRLAFSLNDGPPVPLAVGGDEHRLAGPGDFNIEIGLEELRPGVNRLLIAAAVPDGRTTDTEVRVNYHPDREWALPCEIDWSRVEDIQDAVQVVDGRWRRTPEGIRTEEPNYDRMLAVGDMTWTDYEVFAEVTLHDFSPPRGGPPHYGVTHFGLATRWTGHEPDDFQPHVRWYPLGATAEFRLSRRLWRCSWRIIGDKGRLIESRRRRRIRKNRRYRMKHRVETLENGHTRYRVKLWPDSKREPPGWDLEWIEERGDLPAGSALLIAHHSDVTFGRIRIDPVE